ncbi:hydrolase of HD superfamily [Strigomonas culicis]|uniref:5'-deoxynucleotidase n=1 Tax=Strigomonas culicis TaxID=28005 RepID=S9W1W3_9TRYP|nr:hydrolase of HD superfamily [Strigomonas culicis]EPY33486.1 hydrolase of HD superfamily [Strigomonas culicis]|eukprot:EPY23893.1 hydrolase of HD superfamily [Strigomonas culicis]
MSFTAHSPAALDCIQFLHTIGRLKDTPRTGWVENQIPNVESVSDHMYRMSLLCMMCPDETLDRNRMMRMALCHDAGESIIGDISPAMKVPAAEKHAKEMVAVAKLRDLANASSTATPVTGGAFGDELFSLFMEYEEQQTPESKFVRDMDLLEMIVQAHSYEAMNPGKDLVSFFRSGARIKHPWARAIFETLESTRPFLKGSANKVPSE